MLPWMPSWVGDIDPMKRGYTLENRRVAVLAFALLVFFWGSVWGAIKIGLEYAPPLLFAGTRMLICGGVLTLAALVWPELRREVIKRQVVATQAMLHMHEVLVSRGTPRPDEAPS